MVATTTPNTITRSIRELCTRVGIVADPCFLHVRPRPDSLLADCFNDVKRQVNEYGGEAVHGWLIWEWPGILVEAEFHAVWQSPQGVLVDVSMKGEGEEIVLFAVDPTRVFDGTRVNNVRHAIGKDPRIRTLIQSKNLFFKLSQERYGNVVGEVELDDDLAELAALQQELWETLAKSPAAINTWVAFKARGSARARGA